ncbi:hypothetical protein [uncultured Draconibacterium sp.]|uniref:hypothetical protein n=1 Tax=uncultured Draconibacterium sp. TaxID=1573823 RepID=UPI002AA7AA36|nr:hypothetical protein [uncultured Draconibacterium sp.]
MKNLLLFCLAFALFIQCYGQQNIGATTQKIVVKWNNENPFGFVEIENGKLAQLKIAEGKGRVNEHSFKFNSVGDNSIELTLDSIQINNGAGATLITVNTEKNPFSFFLRDVNLEYPILIPAYEVCVLTQNDKRNYQQIEDAVLNKKLLSKLEQIKREPEESFNQVKDRTRDQQVPTWLGTSRDIRTFQVALSLESSPTELDLITPKYSAYNVVFPETEPRPMQYIFACGRGHGVEVNIKRRLDEGILPILHATKLDGEINYHSVFFVTLEQQALGNKASFGTDFMVADNFCYGHNFTKEQAEIMNPQLEEFKNDENEQTVLFGKIEATNTGRVPRYAWFKTPRPAWGLEDYKYDSINGFSEFSEDRIFCISKLNGTPLGQQEIAVLIEPGKTVTLEFFLPHSPISNERAKNLSNQPFEEKYLETKRFWKDKFEQAAQVQLPEKRIEEMMKAGFLHLDLITYGKEPAGILAPVIGVYSPIGTESAPIIQFYCSIGRFDLAKRSLQFFLEKQHDNGAMMNFNGYMIETGATLWCMGEYFRYTNDVKWLNQEQDKLLKSCNYLIDWRNRNKKDELIGKGYGMIDGKVADPNDPYHQFMLNGYGYLGLVRMAEVFESINPQKAEELKAEAKSWKTDILASFYHSRAHSPVVPLGDGNWCPTVPPWPETQSPRALFNDNKTYFSHGTFMVPDALLGPLYLTFCEILSPNDLASEMMLNYQSELFYQNNATYSQPYYSRHNWLQLQMGLVKPFLKTYYNTFSALADRETYSFWEHTYQVSSHKTHEEAWFLMQTRWMLYLEKGDTLSLLPGIPRRWLEDDQIIELNNVVSYFGKFSLHVESHVNEDYIDVAVKCKDSRKPGKLVVRIPHPEGLKAAKVDEGIYDKNTETVTVDSFNGEANFRIWF